MILRISFYNSQNKPIYGDNVGSANADFLHDCAVFGRDLEGGGIWVFTDVYQSDLIIYVSTEPR